MTAAGKSTLGRNISSKLGWKFKDLDHEVEEYVGMEISDMVAKIEEDKNNPNIPDDEAWTMETINAFFMNTYNSLSNQKNTIVATGGFFGIYNKFDNSKNIFFIDVSKDIFLDRIIDAKKNPDHKDNKNRRIVKLPITTAKEQYDDRKPIYEEKSTQIFKVNSNNDMRNLSKKVINSISSLIKKEEKNKNINASNNSFNYNQ
jgi:shikimate kinase